MSSIMCYTMTLKLPEVHLNVHQASVNHPASRPPAVWGSKSSGQTAFSAAALAFVTAAAAWRFCGSSELAMPDLEHSRAPGMRGIASSDSFTCTCMENRDNLLAEQGNCLLNH